MRLHTLRPSTGAGLRPARPHLGRLIRAAQAAKEEVSTLEALDALLSQDEAGPEPEEPSRPAKRAVRREAMTQQSKNDERFGLAWSRGNWSNLAVGQVTEVGAAHDLPTSEPLVSYLFAGWAFLASGATALLPGLFPAEGTVMYSSLAEEGILAPFVTANWVCPTWPNLAAGVALLLTAGGAAERTLGRSRFASIYVLAGVSAHVWYYGLSIPGDPAAYQCGVAGGLVGVLVALATVGFKNARVLTLPQRLRLWGTAAGGVAGAVAADALLWSDHTFIGGAYWAAAITGLALGAAMAPRYEILREVLIPDGSMEIPEDAPEVQVVVDKTSGLQQWGACLGFAAVLGAFTLLLTGLPLPEDAIALGPDGQLAGTPEALALLQHYLLHGGPEAAEELYNLAPEAWPLKA